MLTQIKAIKDIGIFKNYSANNTGIQLDFDKLNLVYGHNCSGKSTLSDIFIDLSKDSNENINNRITIPNGESPLVVLQQSDGAGIIKYEQGHWLNNSLKHHVFVFNDDFVNKNVFDGAELIKERETRENFTDFILGDVGVAIASELEKLKKAQRERKIELKYCAPLSVKQNNDTQIRQYCELAINETKESLIAQHAQIQADIDNIQRQQKNGKAINDLNNLEIPEDVSVYTFVNNIDSIKKVLSKTFSIDAELIESFHNAVSQRHGDIDIEHWLEIGVTLWGNGEYCPFCGQPISNSKNINIWRDYFNDDYQHYVKEVNEEIDAISIDSDIFVLSNMLESIRIYLSKAEGVVGKNFLCDSKTIEDLSSSIRSFDKIYKPKIKDIAKIAEAALVNKRVIPYLGFDLNIEIVNDFKKEYDVLVTELEKAVSTINSSLNKIKKGLAAGKMQDDISHLKKELDKVEKKISRISEESQCDQWLQLADEIEREKKEIEKKSLQLEEEQSAYLDRYFNYINYLFKRFGGREFKISQGEYSNKGYKKVLGINVDFCETPLDGGRTKFVFSESDRRALALAIFFARINAIPEIEKRQAVIVLDDPVTSFDDNRIKNVALELASIASNVSQMFIFTHYLAFANKLFEIKKNEMRCFELKAESGRTVAGIYDCNPDELFASAFGKAYFQIHKFINGESDSFSDNELRVFLEEYLNVVFAKQLREGGKTKESLDGRIKYLVSIDCLSEDFAQKLLNYKGSLNADSHSFQDNTIEDSRNYAYALIEDLFSNVKLGR